MKDAMKFGPDSRRCGLFSLMPTGMGITTLYMEVAAFPNLGADQRVELAEATFESGWAEHLQTLSSGGSVSSR